MKTALRNILYETGLFGLFHRVRHRKTLTTIMLHRVLPPQLQTSYGSTPEWTLSETTFEELLIFANDCYNIVSLDEVEKAFFGTGTLPDYALLLTFDDGWLDNYRFAYPILAKNSLPATIFIATDYIGSVQGFWQEKVHAAVLNNPNLLESLTLLAPNPSQISNVTSLIYQLQNLEPVELNCKQIMGLVQSEQNPARQMLNSTEIREMSNNGITFGVHGASHRPLATLTLTEIKHEIESSVTKLSSIIGKSIQSISFPHGSFSPEVQACCIDNGLTCQFTSKSASITRPLPKSSTVFHHQLFPRLHIAEKAITRQGIFSPVETANKLFRLTKT